MTLTRKLFIINFAWAALVAWAWFMGYVQRVTEADAVHMAYVIAAVFAAGLASTFWQARKVDERMRQRSWTGNERERGYTSIVRESAHLYDVFVALFLLGIIGNAIGFLVAFGGVDVGALSDPEGIRKAGAQLLSGAGTAFGSTLVGLTLALWTSVNLRILATATDRLAP
ncbi:MULTISPECIES: hypothetical protein [unclassified Mesorhizobium]|uniref:hypothetical protein n=1 Tax=unclassified Mesorhizobium TaxID=325217 RepID=UPI00112DB13D|nr:MULTISPECIES: hypothetical protein [unclassified Mesorhizobium]TPJ86975.1 hypothetical protein FJ489_30985 [Mesorhizobium sp. B2-5-12]TPK19198.1 hypothetical protein FJ562_31390 [Mesorhizobium sp. B2-5-6]